MKRLALVLAALLSLPVVAGISGFVRVDETYFAKESGTKRVVILPGASLWVLKPGATVSATNTSGSIPVYDSDTLVVGNVIEVSSSGAQAVITSIPNLTTVVVSPAVSFATGDRLLQIDLEILLYIDPTGGVTLTQPVIAGPNGEVGFYMSDGEPVYDIKVVGTDGTRVFRYDIPNAGGGTGPPGGGEPPAGVPTDVQLKEGTGFGIAPGFKANPATGDVQMRGPISDVKAFGALCDGVTDDGVAINAAIAATPQWTGTAGGEILIPQGICMTSIPIVAANIGINIRGENTRTSVIKAMPGFTPGPDGGIVVFKKGISGGSDKATAAKISNLSIEANDVDAHALLMLEPYDQISIDNIYVDNCEDAYNCLRITPNTAEVGGNVISQTIEINNSSFIKRGLSTPATAAVVYLERTQEVVITGSKAFSGAGSYVPGSGAHMGPLWHINGGRGIVMNGISAAFSNGPCILLEGEAATNSVQGVGIYTPTIEGCDVILETKASGGGCSGGTVPPGTACTLPGGAECLGGGTCIPRTIQRVAMHNPRYQYNTFNGVIKLDDLQISEIHANGAVTSLSPTCDQNRIMSQRPSAVRNIAGVDCGTVVDGSCGTNNEIRSWSNAIDTWGSVNTPFAVRRASTPEFQWRVPFHDPAYWKMLWSADNPDDFGWQLGFVDPAGAFQRYMQIDSATGNVQAKIINGVRQAAEYAEFGTGSSSFPYLGWEDAICDQCQTHFAAGHYATSTGVDLQLTLNNRPGRTSITGDGFESTTITTTADVTALRVRATVGVCNVGGAFCTATGGECGVNTCVMTGQIHLEGLGFSAGVNNTQAAGLVSIEGMDTQWSMRNISIRDRNLAGTTSQAVNLGLRILNSQNAVIENLYVRSTQSAVPTMLTGVFITSNDAAQRGNLTFVGGQVSRVGTAFKIDTAHCLAGANKGLWCDDAGDCPGSSCVNENNLSGISFYGMKLVNGAGTVALPGPQQNTKGFDVEAAGDSLLFSNVHIENFQTGIELDGTNGFTILGGIISGANNNNQTPTTGHAIRIGETTNVVGGVINAPTFANCYSGVTIGATDTQRLTYIKGYVTGGFPGLPTHPLGVEWTDNSTSTVDITTASAHGNMRIEGGTFPDGLVVKRQDSNTNGLWLWNNDTSTETEHSPNLSFTPSGITSTKDTKIRTNNQGNLEFLNNASAINMSLLQSGVVRIPGLVTCTALETNSSGDIICGVDDGSGGSLSVDGTPVSSPNLQDSTDILFTPTVSNIQATIVNNAVTYAKLQQAAGAGVVGRPNPGAADHILMTALNNGEVLRRSGSTVGFGAIDLESPNIFGATIMPGAKVQVNTLANAGVVPMGSGNANKVWATDGAGTPSWSTPPTGGSGDAIIIGSTAVTSPDSATFNNTTPAAVSGANVLWQYTSPNVSAYTPLNTASVAGVASAPGVVNNKVWKTGPSGEAPGWRDDAGGGSGDQVVVNGGGDITSPVSFQTSGDIAFSNPSGSNIQATFVPDSIGSSDVGILDADADTNLGVNAPLLFSGSVISLPAASGTVAGHVTTGPQTIAGNKTFLGDVVAASFDSPADDEDGGVFTIREGLDEAQSVPGTPDMFQIKVEDDGGINLSNVCYITADGRLDTGTCLDQATLVQPSFFIDAGDGLKDGGYMDGVAITLATNSTEPEFIGFSSTTGFCTGPTRGKFATGTGGFFGCDGSVTPTLRLLANAGPDFLAAGVSDTYGVDGGDSGAGLARPVPSNIIKIRRADNCTTLNDGKEGEQCIDQLTPDLGTLYTCLPDGGTGDCVGAEWKAITGSGGGSFLALSDTPDTYVDGKIVRSTASAMEFADAINVDHTTGGGPSLGSMLYYNTTGAEYDVIPPGTTGQVLTGNTGAAPSWGAGGGISLSADYAWTGKHSWTQAQKINAEVHTDAYSDIITARDAITGPGNGSLFVDPDENDGTTFPNINPAGVANGGAAQGKKDILVTDNRDGVFKMQTSAAPPYGWGAVDSATGATAGQVPIVIQPNYWDRTDLMANNDYNATRDGDSWSCGPDIKTCNTTTTRRCVINSDCPGGETCTGAFTGEWETCPTGHITGGVNSQDKSFWHSGQCNMNSSDSTRMCGGPSIFEVRYPQIDDGDGVQEAGEHVNKPIFKVGTYGAALFFPETSHGYGGGMFTIFRSNDDPEWATTVKNMPFFSIHKGGVSTDGGLFVGGTTMWPGQEVSTGAQSYPTFNLWIHKDVPAENPAFAVEGPTTHATFADETGPLALIMSANGYGGAVHCTPGSSSCPGGSPSTWGTNQELALGVYANGDVVLGATCPTDDDGATDCLGTMTDSQRIIWEGTNPADANRTLLSPVDPTGARVVRIPDKSGTLAVEKPETLSFVLNAPATTDDGAAQSQLPVNATITRIICSTMPTSSTATVNINVRGETTPNATGSDVLSSDVVCDSDSQVGTINVSNDNVTARQLLALEVSAVSSSPVPTYVRVHVEYTID